MTPSSFCPPFVQCRQTQTFLFLFLLSRCVSLFVDYNSWPNSLSPSRLIDSCAVITVGKENDCRWWLKDRRENSFRFRRKRRSILLPSPHPIRRSRNDFLGSVVVNISYVSIPLPPGCLLIYPTIVMFKFSLSTASTYKLKNYKIPPISAFRPKIIIIVACAAAAANQYVTNLWF